MLYTVKQGQYLAFIFYYTKIHGQPPAEADLQRYFKVSPPAVHQMIVTLEWEGLITRVPGQARSIRLLLRREQLPDLLRNLLGARRATARIAWHYWRPQAAPQATHR